MELAADSESRQDLEGQLFAAVDLGSNSFHLVVARYEHGQLRVIDRVRDMVRMAAGFDRAGRLSNAARSRALSCLSRMGHRLNSIPTENVRAVGTNTVRRLHRPAAFLISAETALGHPIEIISGREEARLVYLGVERGLASQGRRLVFDIGGGSTEMVVGKNAMPRVLESMRRGCVGISERYFPDGEVTASAWHEACTNIAVELRDMMPSFLEFGWDEVVGSSGTCRAISKVITQAGWSDHIVTADSLDRLRARVIELGPVSEENLPGLSAARAPVFAGGLAILWTLFREFNVTTMAASEYALREGVLYDLLGRITDRDPRDETIDSLAARYQIDEQQAARVMESAELLFDQVAKSWRLAPIHRAILRWAVRVHELGLAIAHDHHQRHGAYVLANSDLAGFSRREQSVLAALVAYHRGTTKNADFKAVPSSLLEVCCRLVSLLRIAVILNRGRHPAIQGTSIELRARELKLTLATEHQWLDRNPLTAADLRRETHYQAELGIELVID